MIVILAALAGLYMAWNIGANDVANAMGTSVGSGALTHKKAVVVAGVLEFCGASLVGMHVTETIRKKIITPTDFPPEVLMIGMVAALLGAGTWLLVATSLGRPVSTTHSIVGAIAGFGLILGGFNAVQWSKIGEIVLSWIVTPALSGAIAYAVFTGIERSIIQTSDPVGQVRRWFPLYAFAVLFIMSLVTIFKGLANLHLDLNLQVSIAVAMVVGGIAAACGGVVARRAEVGEAVDDDGNPLPPLALEHEIRHLRERLGRLRPEANPEVATRLAAIDAELVQLAGTSDARRSPVSLRPEYRFVERLFGMLQVLSACFVAFAHGSNDVANAVGPLAAVVAIANHGEAALTGKSPVPMWVLLLGATGIVLGLATFGRRVMATIGQRITHLTPTRGFAAEFAAATTIVLASRLGLPVSTTHTLVGGVMGVGLARGIASLDPGVVRDIVIAWLIEIPAAALFSVLFYFLLQAVL